MSAENIIKQEENNPRPKRKGRWKPGECGNPNGRPKKKGTTELIRQMLGEEAPPVDGRRPGPYRVLLIRKLLAMALQGDIKAAQMLLDRDDPPSLHLKHEEIIQVQIAMEIAQPPRDWAPRMEIVQQPPRALLGGGNGQ